MINNMEIITISNVVKNLVKKGKSLNKQIRIAREEYHDLGSYEDCGEFYKNNLLQLKAKLEIIVELKISYEKYLKKLKYENKE